MRLFLALPVLSLLLGALANPLDLREPTPHGLDARQAVSDVCYPVSTGGVLLNQSKTVCLCYPDTGALRSTISANDLSTIHNLILQLLNPGLPPCNYPVHGVPTCQEDNRCGFTCNNGNTVASRCTSSS